MKLGWPISHTLGRPSKEGVPWNVQARFVSVNPTKEGPEIDPFLQTLIAIWLNTVEYNIYHLNVRRNLFLL